MLSVNVLDPVVFHGNTELSLAVWYKVTSVRFNKRFFDLHKNARRILNKWKDSKHLNTITLVWSTSDTMHPTVVAISYYGKVKVPEHVSDHIINREEM